MGTRIIKTTLRFKRGTASDWATVNPILKLGEPGFVVDTNKLKIGDGRTHWNNLPYITGGGANIVADGESLEVFLEDGVYKIRMKNFSNANIGDIPIKNSSGYIEWVNLDTKVSNKQDKLVSGTNIKTINNLSILGEGNITIGGGGGGTTDHNLLNNLDYANSAHTGFQAEISDLTTIRSGAAAGATAYQKPSTGIPRSDLAADASSSNAYTYINQVDDFLYETQYTSENIDQNFCYEYFMTNPTAAAGCTGVYYNKKVLRHLDWNYDNEVDFLVRRPADRAAGKYGNVGLAACLPSLTKAFVGTGAYSEKYKLVPYAMCDGVNEKGVFFQQNVVPKKTNDIDVQHTHTTYKGKITTNMIGRIILDNCASVSEIMTELSKYDIKRTPRMPDIYDSHYLVADANGNHGILEYSADGHSIVLRSYGNTKNAEILSNFNTDTGITVDTFALDWDAISTDNIHNAGLERWELAAEELAKASPDISSLRTKLMYTNSYKESSATWTAWLTEYVGEEYAPGQVLTPAMAKTNPERFTTVLQSWITKYNNRSRETGETWQTVHSALYDLEKKTLDLVIQERESEKHSLHLELDEFSDAPSDNKQYARKNGAWVEVTGGSGTTDHSALSNLAFDAAGHTGFASTADTYNKSAIDEKFNDVISDDFINNL